MKLPFSYKRDFFSLAALASVMGHVTVFSAAGFVGTLQPAYDVERGIASMEIVLIKEPVAEEEIRKPQETIFSSLKNDESSKIEDEVRVEDLREEIKPDETVIIPETQGAIESEARPDHLKNHAPKYPEYARQKGWEGLVVVRVEVSAVGRVKEAAVEKSSGYLILDQAAVSTIEGWVFQPARIAGTYLASTVRIPVRFLLESS